MKNFFESKTFGIILIIIAGLAIIIFIFKLGFFIGTKRADFSFRWAESYHRNFGGPSGGFLGNMIYDDFTSANGVFGQIIKIEDGKITVKDRDNTEKIISITDETVIVSQKNNLTLSDLRVGDSVVIVGEPADNGQIDAELIRVMPPMPQKPSAYRIPLNIEVN